jgi:hypothetical protein
VTGRGAEPRPLSVARLNELLVKMYERRIIRVLYDDPTKPWLPESYWREDFERNVQTTTSELMGLLEKERERKRYRKWEDQQLEHASVDELLDEMDRGVARLWQPERGSWGVMEMRHSGGTLRQPTQGEVQPAFNWECYQCGRPITDSGKDHAGRTRCDAALMPADDEPYAYHTAKPWDGEEDDDDE